MSIAIAVPHTDLAEFCRRHHICRLSLFGSALRDDFGPDSDVDVLVEFAHGHTPGWEIAAIEDELSAMIGRQIDLRTPEELSHRWRQQVIAAAQIIHEQAGS